MQANERIDARPRAPQTPRPTEPRRAPARSVRRTSTPAGKRRSSLVPPDLRAAELVGALGRAISSRPVTAALIALTGGFVLGGALSFRTGRAALAFAGRQLVTELLKELL